MRFKFNYSLALILTCAFLSASSFFSAASANPSPTPTSKSKTEVNKNSNNDTPKSKVKKDDSQSLRRMDLSVGMEARKGKAKGKVLVSRRVDLRDNIKLTMKGLPPNKVFYVASFNTGRNIGFGKAPYSFRTDGGGNGVYFVEGFNSVPDEYKFLRIYLVRDGNPGDISPDNLTEYMRAAVPDFVSVLPKKKEKKAAPRQTLRKPGLRTPPPRSSTPSLDN